MGIEPGTFYSYPQHSIHLATESLGKYLSFYMYCLVILGKEKLQVPDQDMTAK